MNEILLDKWYNDLNSNKKLEKFRKFFNVVKDNNKRINLFPTPSFFNNWRNFDSITIFSQELSYDLTENKKRYGKPRLFINVMFDDGLKTKELIDYDSWKKIINYLKTLTNPLPNPYDPPSYSDFFEL